MATSSCLQKTQMPLHNHNPILQYSETKPLRTSSFYSIPWSFLIRILNWSWGHEGDFTKTLGLVWHPISDLLLPLKGIPFALDSEWWANSFKTPHPSSRDFSTLRNAEIKEELNKQGHTVRDLYTQIGRKSKEPLVLVNSSQNWGSYKNWQYLDVVSGMVSESQFGADLILTSMGMTWSMPTIHLASIIRSQYSPSHQKIAKDRFPKKWQVTRSVSNRCMLPLLCSRNTMLQCRRSTLTKWQLRQWEKPLQRHYRLHMLITNLRYI